MSFSHSWQWDSSWPLLPLPSTLTSCWTPALHPSSSRVPRSQVIPLVFDFKPQTMETYFKQWLSWDASLGSSLNLHLKPLLPFHSVCVNAHVTRSLSSVHKVVFLGPSFLLVSPHSDLKCILNCSGGTSLSEWFKDKINNNPLSWHSQIVNG